MFDIDRWQEIFETIRTNKLRTFLTSISVASGIFILVILLGFGQGMENGIKKEFEADATNRIWVWTEVTTKEYKGLNPGRYIQLENEDYNNLTSIYKNEIEYQSDLHRVRGVRMNYNEEVVAYRVEAVSPNYQQIENQKMILGRFINYSDLESNNKVIVISNKIKNELLKGVENPLDEYFQLSDINFKIIGVYTDPGGDREESRVYIPISTAQAVFNGATRVDNMTFTVQPQETFEQTLAVSNQFSEEIKQYLKQAHLVSPEDLSAINTYNAMEEAKRYFTLTSNIALFFWFVGICTIIAGVVGVSNIMLIIVKERTKEIGIRKALGAKPWSIIWMILQESIFVTSVAGFVGLIFSMALLEVVGPHIEVDYILNPSVNFSMAITMVFVLIIAGTFAGFIPAWKAATIQPVKALSHE
jgi:putative ABC transport system permease protein